MTQSSLYKKGNKKVKEKSRGCHNHKPQPFPDTKKKRKQTKPNKRKSNKHMKSTKIRTEKHKNIIKQGKAKQIAS